MTQKLEISRKHREKLEEVVNNLESIGVGQIGTLKNVLKKYVDNWDDEEGRKNLESECHRLLELADKNANLAKQQQRDDQKYNDSGEEDHKLEGLSTQSFDDVVKKKVPVGQV